MLEDSPYLLDRVMGAAAPVELGQPALDSVDLLHVVDTLLLRRTGLDNWRSVCRAGSMLSACPVELHRPFEHPFDTL